MENAAAMSEAIHLAKYTTVGEHQTALDCFMGLYEAECKVFNERPLRKIFTRTNSIQYALADLYKTAFIAGQRAERAKRKEQE